MQLELNFYKKKDMKSFREYISNNNKEDSLSKLIKLTWERYNPEIRDFFEKISSKDADIRQLLQEIDDPESSEEPDVISKNASDSNFGNGEI
jgi:hypothetical protein